MNIEGMTRKEKIELLKKLQSGELSIISGEIVGSGVVITHSGDEYFINGKPVGLEAIEAIAETVVILPERGKV